MEIRAVQAKVAEYISDALIVYHLEGEPLADSVKILDEKLSGAIGAVIEHEDYKGTPGEISVFYSHGAIASTRVIVCGLGLREKLTTDTIRRAAAAGLLKARSLKAKQSGVVLPVIEAEGLQPAALVQAAVEGIVMGLYIYHGQKSSEAPAALPEVIEFLTDDPAAMAGAVEAGRAFADGTNLARELANLPPNICQPVYLAGRAEQLASETGLSVRVLEPQQMAALKMGALLAVAQGSDAPPRFIILEHNADRAAELDTVVLVGKGVTFDTGGYSLKTADGMVGMKGDMGGAAAVLGAMLTVARLQVPLHVVALIPTVENMVSSNSYRPQDVVTASNGKTIEIISTDAEGRLILADALVYAQRYQPAAVVNIATLTGAMVIALGNAAAGVYGNSDVVAGHLSAAGDHTFERVWRLPLFEEYGKPLESDTADMKNSGGAAGRGGGAGVAAHFLSNFVDYPWAHIDMAGMMNNTGDIAYMPKNSARGYGARLLAEFVRQWAGS